MGATGIHLPGIPSCNWNIGIAPCRALIPIPLPTCFQGSEQQFRNPGDPNLGGILKEQRDPGSWNCSGKKGRINWARRALRHQNMGEDVGMMSRGWSWIFPRLGMPGVILGWGPGWSHSSHRRFPGNSAPPGAPPAHGGAAGASGAPCPRWNLLALLSPGITAQP